MAIWLSPRDCMKILLIEEASPPDSPLNRVLRNAGHELVLASGSRDAIARAEETHIDLVMLDCGKQHQCAIDTTRELRQALKTYWIPIILVTDNAGEAFLSEAVDAGGDDFLIRPLSPAMLTAKVRALGRITDMQTQLERLNAKLQAQSQRDSLTDLYNRRAFEELAEKQWRIQTRAREPISVLMVDVDHFKQYNDHNGHQAGDVTLASVARALRSSLRRPSDLIARYGGEEFIVLLSNTDYQGTVTVAEALREVVYNLEIPHNHSETSDNITISIGGCVVETSSGIRLNELVEIADRALYDAKRQGRNRCVIRHEVPRKTVLIAEGDAVNRALLSSQLDQRYQVLTTSSGVECIELAYNLQPDLIILSRSLNDGDGQSLCRQLKGQEQTRAIPVLLLLSDAQSRGDGAEAANATMTGTMDEARFMELVKSLLG